MRGSLAGKGKRTTAMDSTEEALSLCNAASTSSASSEHRRGSGRQSPKCSSPTRGENPWVPGWVPALQGRNSYIQKQILKHCLAS